MIESLRRGSLPFALTTDLVLNETVTILGRRKGFGAKKAQEAASLIISSPRVFVVYVDESIFKASLELYPEFNGKLGMTDTSSVVAMRKYGVKEIFSHDSDFDRVLTLVRKADLE